MNLICVGEWEFEQSVMSVKQMRATWIVLLEAKNKEKNCVTLSVLI